MARKQFWTRKKMLAVWVLATAAMFVGFGETSKDTRVIYDAVPLETKAAAQQTTNLVALN